MEVLEASGGYWSGGYVRESRGGKINSPSADFESANPIFEEAWPILEDLDCGSYIEFGCNAGRNLKTIYQTTPNVKLTGIDINSDAIEYLKSYFTPASIWRFFVGDMSDPSFLGQIPSQAA